MTKQDEISINIGVIGILQYFTNNIYFDKGETFNFPPGSLVMPCFDNEKLFILAQEIDIMEHDRMYIEFQCEQFQIGQNTSSVSIYEDHSALMATTTVVEHFSGYTFGFTLDDLVDNSVPAVYDFVFNVTSVCTEDSFNETEIKDATGINIQRYNRRGLNETEI